MWRLQVNARSLLLWLPFPFLRWGLLLGPELILFNWKCWPSTPNGGITVTCHCTGILHGVWNPNSGSHACTARLNYWPYHKALERLLRYK